MQFTFIVGFAFSKDTLKEGRPDEDFAAVTVVADSVLDAFLCAEQMVAALGYEPTSCERTEP